MRHTILISIFLGAFIGVNAQNTKEEKVIEEKIDAFINSWNKHDFSDMKNYIAEDCDFVNTTGMHWKGRYFIQYAHQTFSSAIFQEYSYGKASSNDQILKTGYSYCPFTLAHRCFYFS